MPLPLRQTLAVLGDDALNSSISMRLMGIALALIVACLLAFRLRMPSYKGHPKLSAERVHRSFYGPCPSSPAPRASH